MMALQRKKPLQRTHVDRLIEDRRRRRELRSGKPLPTRSRRKADADRELAAARVLVVIRDWGRCRLAGRGGCAGPVRVHHIRYRSRSRVDQHDTANLTALCEAHHGWVHSHDEDAHALGLALHAGEPFGDAWQRMHAAGLSLEPVPSAPPARPAPKGYGSLCADCSAAGAPHRIGHNFYCDTCSDARFGETG